MINKKQKKIFAVLTVLCQLSLTFVSLGEEVATDHENVNLQTQYENSSPVSISYNDYMTDNSNVFNSETIKIDAVKNFTGQNVYVDSSFGDRKEPVLITGEEGFAQWNIYCGSNGLYRIYLNYFPVNGNGEAIERTVKIDGSIPFNEAIAVTFPRYFKDDSGVLVDENGDDVRSNQSEIQSFRNRYINDTLGYHGEYLYFYLAAGKHTIALESVKEPMAIKEIVLESIEDNTQSYEQYIEKHKKNGAKISNSVLNDGLIIHQAEKTLEKNDLTLHPLSDRTSASAQPFDALKIRLNTIGGIKWRYPGQFISWEIDIPESGLYNISLKAKQNYVRGLFTNRKLYIDYKLPFKEAQNLEFIYHDAWVMNTVGNDNPYLFYLEKGKRIITLEATVGNLSSVLTEADTILKKLNSANWDVMTLTGATPDVNRNYRLDERMPYVLDEYKTQYTKIDELVKLFEDKTGQKSDQTVVLKKLSDLLKKVVDDPTRISELFKQIRDYVGALGDWILATREQPLLLDYIVVSEPVAKLPNANSSIFEDIKYSFLSFLYSFFNYDAAIAGINKSDRGVVTVWIGAGISGGRDQVQALKQMIKQDFIKTKEIPVDVQLVAPGTVLPATLSGKGPDVVMQMGGSDPVNFAMRKAVVDLTQFNDFEEISKRFSESSMVPFTYLNGVYALPETMSFPMMFYRKDILEKLNIDVNRIKTWQDVVGILSVLQKKNMNFAVPANMHSYAMFLYQMDGNFYKNEGRLTNLDDSVSLEAFNQWMDLYMSYRLPKEFNFENRFRVGEIPIGIAEYTSYNLLSVSAPEIKGQWGMVPVPGTKRADGSINNTVPITVQGSIMLSATKSKENSWEFLKWWTSTNTQLRFGKELESIMGTAARYNSANIDAIKQLPWPSNDKKMILEQLGKTKGIPEVPGGYYTSRNLEFAIRKVFNENVNPNETILSYIKSINDEIKLKRIEFGLK